MDRARSVAYAFTMFGVRPGWLSRPISRPPARSQYLDCATCSRSPIPESVFWSRWLSFSPYQSGPVRLQPTQALDYAVLAFTGVLMFAFNCGLLFWGELHVPSGLAAVTGNSGRL